MRKALPILFVMAILNISLLAQINKLVGPNVVNTTYDGWSAMANKNRKFLQSFQIEILRSTSQINYYSKQHGSVESKLKAKQGLLFRSQRINFCLVDA